MNVSVQLFARAKDLAGADAISLVLPAGATVAQLRLELVRNRPVLAGLVERSAIAVNDEFSEDNLPLPHNAKIALLPPVSGG
jgi:molybdopterin converting factor small subunit